jgi:hypothetical protein
VKIIAKRKMPASLVGNVSNYDDGWPSYEMEKYMDAYAVKWGVPEDKVGSILFRVRHVSFQLDYPNKDLFIAHYTKESCAGKVLCMRVTKRGKTIIIAEHGFHKCPRIYGRSKE